MLKVIFCTPTREKPCGPYIDSLEKSIPLIVGAGYAEGYLVEVGNPYISGARATMLKKGLKAQGDIFIFLDDDLSWEPEALLRLIQTPGEVVGGTYRTKEDEPNYMGRILQDKSGRPTSIREDGCFECACLPAGFLKVTKEAVADFMRGYPDLCYGPPYDYAVDFMQHGAHKGMWWGEDYAFCRRWRDIGGQVWLIPDIEVQHHDWKSKAIYRGNFHEYLMRQPGGVKEVQPYASSGYEKPDAG
jgi:glycosyltransferase involved in cell wall biosynthesis